MYIILPQKLYLSKYRNNDLIYFFQTFEFDVPWEQIRDCSLEENTQTKLLKLFVIFPLLTKQLKEVKGR